MLDSILSIYFTNILNSNILEVLDRKTQLQCVNYSNFIVLGLGEEPYIVESILIFLFTSADKIDVGLLLDESNRTFISV